MGIFSFEQDHQTCLDLASTNHKSVQGHALHPMRQIHAVVDAYMSLQEVHDASTFCGRVTSGS